MKISFLAILLIVLWSIPPLPAQSTIKINIKINKDALGKIILSASKEVDISEELAALSKFANRFHNETKELTIAQEMVDDHPFQTVDISSVFSPAIRELIGTHPSVHGPNCFNFSLLVNQCLLYPRMTSDKELMSWLKSPLCKEVTFEKVSPGDLITITNQQNKAIHAFNYISNAITLSKDGGLKYSPYEIKSMAEVMKEYEVGNDCWPQVKGNDCPKRVSYFHCQTMQEYLAQNDLHQKDKQVNLVDDWNGVECALNGELITENTQDKSEDLDNLSDSESETDDAISKINQLYYQMGYTFEKADRDKIGFWTVLLDAIDSMKDQLVEMRKITPQDEYLIEKGWYDLPSAEIHQKLKLQL